MITSYFLQLIIKYLLFIINSKVLINDDETNKKCAHYTYTIVLNIFVCSWSQKYKYKKQKS